jgi:FG-GAP repeat/FG-GAP-like repeat
MRINHHTRLFLVCFLLGSLLLGFFNRKPSTDLFFQHSIFKGGVLPAATDSMRKDSLKKSGWFQEAIHTLEQEKYHIKPIPGQTAWAALNPAHHLSFTYYYNGFTVKPVSENPIPAWQIQFTVTGISRSPVREPLLQNPVFKSDQNQARVDYNNLGISYHNSTAGMRQDFIVKKRPEGKDNLRLHFSVSTPLSMNVEPAAVGFETGAHQFVMQYNQLKVWDAGGQPLEAVFVQESTNRVAIEVNDADAIYPITIDPISSSPTTSLDDGNQASAFFGYSVSSAGDVNGDGYSDIIVGAFLFDEAPNDQRGRAFVYYGSANGVSTTPASILDDVGQDQAFFGYAVATCGDVNNDGYSDVMVSATQYDDGPNTNEGRVFVYHGSAAGLPASPNYVLDDGDDQAVFGFDIAPAGDVNNDGYSDVVIGSQGDELIYIYHGSATGLGASPAAIRNDNDPLPSGFGSSVAGAGDVNGDGYSDIIAGAWAYADGANTDEGRAYIFYGSATGIAATPSAIFNHLNVSDAYFGTDVSSAGDVNGDGYSDVVIGAPGMTDGINIGEGLAYVYYGSAAGISVTPAATLDDADNTGAQFGQSVACAGDVNGDGYADVIVGAYTYTDGTNTNEGRSYLYYGSAAGPGATLVSSQEGGAQNNMLFGISVASGGDVNGDGYSDVVVGASQYTESHTNEGRTFIFHGTVEGLSISPAVTFVHDNQANAEKGYFVNSAGDVNSDGYADVLVGARLYDDGGNADEGVVYVYHGSASGLPSTPAYTLDDANQAGARFGISAASAGDVNGDGYGDVIVGADQYDNGSTNEGGAFIYLGSASGLNSTPSVILDGANQASASFGFSVASAGDINSDGYADVVVGAYLFDVTGAPNTGRAYYYYGSATGIVNTPSATTELQTPQAGANYGVSVNGAGDVNGDGYSDVIVGAWSFDQVTVNDNFGAAFIYHGNMAGIGTTAVTFLDDCTSSNGFFGYVTASAGDINGDGFGDIVVGAYNASSTPSNNEGQVYIYHGSAAGVPSVPVLIIEDGVSNGALYGVAVSSAGDINGDGYSDIVVGASFYDGDVTDEGGIFIYYGSPTGVPNTANLVLQEADQDGARFGFKVTTSGDVNGDGYSDIIAGAPQYDDGAGNTGRAYLYYGNNGLQLRNNLRLYNSDLITPIQQSNLADPNLFGIGLYQKSPLGRQSAKLAWETVRNAAPFSGTPITNSTAFTDKQNTFNDLGAAGSELKSQVAKAVPTKYTAVRARTEYHKSKAITGQVYGPWRYPDYFLRGRRDLGAVVLPVKFISFTAVREAETALLRWITTEEQPGVLYEIQHSTDGRNFTTIGTTAARRQIQNEYRFVHTMPAAGNNYYRIKAAQNSKTAFTEIARLRFDKAAAVRLFPNPIRSGSSFTIEYKTPNRQRKVLQLYSTTGQTVWQYTLPDDGALMHPVQPPPLQPGLYIITITSNGAALHQQSLQITH